MNPTRRKFMSALAGLPIVGCPFRGKADDEPQIFIDRNPIHSLRVIAWIPITDKLPECRHIVPGGVRDDRSWDRSKRCTAWKSDEVLLATRSGRVYGADCLKSEDGFFGFGGFEKDDPVTHWAKLPSPPRPA